VCVCVRVHVCMRLSNSLAINHYSTLSYTAFQFLYTAVTVSAIDTADKHDLN